MIPVPVLRSHATTAVHAAVVVLVSGNWKYVIVFFAFSLAAVVPKRFMRAQLRPYYGFAACVALAGLLIVFRQQSGVVAMLHILPGLPSFEPTDRRLAFLGLSYCFLRAVYAVVDDRAWTLAEFARYYFFLPTFASGPVMSPEEFKRASVGANRPLAAQGAARIIQGVVRVAAANLLVTIIPLSARAISGAADWPIAALWGGLFLSGFWLYLNFSGYSEIFIGVSYLLGVRAPENFANPFAASSITAFWQRWHISLGNWLRAIIYNPLGRLAHAASSGTRRENPLLPVVTMLVCGAWHMVTPAFLLWGAAHGGALAAHSLWQTRVVPRLGTGLVRHPMYATGAWVLTHVFIAATWVLFLPVSRDVSLDERVHLLAALFGWR